MNPRERQSPYLTNAKPREKVDVLLMVGPDNVNRNEMRFSIDFTQQYCQQHGLKYAIIGDGKNHIARSDIPTLPKANHLIVHGHGIVHTAQNSAPSHHTELTDDKQASSLQTLQEVQQQTQVTKILHGACYSGKINDDAKKQQSLLPGTELITTSSPDKATNDAVIKASLQTFLSNISSNKKHNANMGQTFIDLNCTVQETLTYGTQTNNGFQSFTTRPEERIAASHLDLNHLVRMQYNRFTDFQQQNGLAPSSFSHVTMQNYNTYNQTAFYQHLWRGDIASADKYLQANPTARDSLHIGLYEIAHFQFQYDSNGERSANKALEFALRQDKVGFSSFFNKEGQIPGLTYYDAQAHTKLRESLLKFADSSDPELSAKIIAGLSKHHSPAELLRECDKLGLENAGKRLIAANPIDDKDIKMNIAEDAYNLAFASDKVKSDPRVVKHAMSQDKNILNHLDNKVIDQLLADKSLDISDVKKLEYDRIDAKLKLNINRLGDHDLNSQERKAINADIASQTRKLHEIKSELAPHHIAQINYKEAREATERVRASARLHTHNEPLSSKMANTISVLADKEEQSRLKLVDAFEGERSRRQNEGKSYTQRKPSQPQPRVLSEAEKEMQRKISTKASASSNKTKEPEPTEPTNNNRLRR